MNTVELSRIIGIIVDNAIEASENLEEPLINIAFIDNEEAVTFIVMNKCSDDIPKIHELFEQGFSTKGDNRGLGLSTLKRTDRLKRECFIRYCHRKWLLCTKSRNK